jgi:hypothetical protein
VKLNSADHGAANLEDTMSQIGLLVTAGIDFLEVSGGTYENPRVREAGSIHSFMLNDH